MLTNRLRDKQRKNRNRQRKEDSTKDRHSYKNKEKKLNHALKNRFGPGLKRDKT